MTININVVKKEKRDFKGSPYYVVRTKQNEEFSAWPNKNNPSVYDTVDKTQTPFSAEINAETTPKGYRNITSIVLSDDVDAPQTPATQPTPSSFNNINKDKHIMREAVLNSSVAFHAMLTAVDHKVPSEAEIMETAEIFEKWVCRGDEK